VRLIGDDGEQVGVLKIDDALRYAQERDLDLVEVAPDAKPPVCRVLDYSKYKYEQAQKQKQARKHQQQITIREIKFRPKIAQHDYDTKKGHVERFLRHKDKVKVTIMFRGREVTHPERGVAILDRLAGELAEFAVIEQRPLQDGRNMTMMLGPSKAVLSGHYDKGANGIVVDGTGEAVVSVNGAAPEESPAAAPEASAAAPEASSSTAAPEASSSSAASEESPAAAPAESSSAAPAESPAAAPEKSSSAAPAQSSSAAPAESSAAAPAESPAAAPAESPAAAPAESPAAAPAESPAAAPADE
jgi:translation initiation factor IF-3